MITAHVVGGSRFVVDHDTEQIHRIQPPVAAHAHRCYELSAKRVAFGPDDDQPFKGYDGAVLVNGTIQGPESPPIGHAWVIEPDGSIWEPYSNSTYPADVFYALFAAVGHVAYSVRETRANIAKSEHTGPWAEEASAAS